MSSKSQVAHYHLRRNTNGEIPERRYAPCVTPPWNTRSILKMTFSSYSIPQINCHPTANYYPTRFTLYQPDSSPHWISYRPLPRKTCGHLKKRNFFFFFFAKISQTKMVNGLIFFSELFNYAAFWVRGLAGRATLSELQRTLQMSLLCSVKLKGRKDGPLTTDSCQWDGTLALPRPMSSHGGDKRLANQLAYKVTALPRAAHTRTRSDSMHSLQLSCSQSCVRVCVSLTHSPWCY